MHLHSISRQYLISKVYSYILILLSTTFPLLSHSYSNSLANIANSAQYRLQINQTNLDFFLGPTLDYRYTKQSTQLFGQPANISVNELFIGVTGGTSISWNRWVNSIFMSIEYGKGRANLSSDTIPIKPISTSFNINHYFFSSSISTGYMLGNDKINSTTSTYIEYNYSNYNSTQDMLLYGTKINKLSQTDNTITAGISQYTNWIITKPLTLSINIGVGYTIFHNSLTTFGSTFPNDTQRGNSGISVSLSTSALYDTSYGRVILAPWMIYSKIFYQDNILDTSIMMTGLKLAYLF